MPKWRNWQTRTVQGRVQKWVWVQLPPSALYISGSSNGRTTDFGSVYHGSPPKADQPLAENPQVIMFYTYVLKSKKDNTRYVGSTDNKEKRLIEHNKGRVRYTKGRRPWMLIYFEEFSTRSEARKKEIFFKSGQGRKSLDHIFGVV